MSNLNENIYDIKDLYVVRFKEGMISSEVKYFNRSLAFIVEKFTTTLDHQEPLFIEYYTECITGEDLSKREGNISFSKAPELFESVEKLPIDYLTKEEIETSSITTTRIFQIFQEINVKSKQLEIKRYAGNS